MGSEFKSKVVDEQMGVIIRHWLAEVRERRKKQEQSVQSARPSFTAEWSPRLSNATTEVLPFLRNKSRRGEIMEEDDDEEERRRRSKAVREADNLLSSGRPH